MLKYRRTLPAAMFAAWALAAAMPARAQEGNAIGPPQLRDFQLSGERRTPARPQPAQPQPQPAQTPPAAQPQPASPPAQAAGERVQPRQRPAATPDQARRVAPREAPPAVPSQPQDVFRLPQAPTGQSAPPPTAAAPSSQPTAPADSAAEPDQGWPLWYWLVPAGLLALGTALLLRRRRRTATGGTASAEPAVAATPPAPRPAPVPRPWLEIELKAERAASTETETWVEFELVLRNTGKSPARNIRVNARMFNAGQEQDKEIGAFFRSKGEGRKTHTIGDLPPDEQGLVQGTVSMPREEMRALQVNQQLLFIPVMAVNVVYDWGQGRTGQSSKSYVIGRELGDETDKMGAFRLDLGPRIYRTVGQRQHSLAKRV